MTLAIVGSTSAIANGTTSATPTVPDGSVNDVIVWVIAWGFSTASSVSDRPSISGALSSSTNHVGSVFGGGGTYGSGTGPRGLSYWSAIATSATGADSTATFTLPAAGTVGGYAIRISAASGKTASAAFTGGSDTNSADSWAPTGFTDIGATTDDLIIHTIASVPGGTNPTAVLTWPGTTLGTESNVRTGNNTSGGGIRTNVRTRSVTSGTSTGAPSVASSTTGITGVHGVLRLREINYNVAPSVSAGADFTVDPNRVDTFSLTGTASDSDGTISSYLWQDVTSTPTDVSGSGSGRTVPVVRNIGGGTRTYRLTVTDNGGLTAFDDVVVTFLPHTRWVKTSSGVSALRRRLT